VTPGADLDASKIDICHRTFNSKINHVNHKLSISARFEKAERQREQIIALLKFNSTTESSCSHFSPYLATQKKYKVIVNRQ